MNCSRPAKSTISSKRARRAACLRQPEDRAVEVDVLAAATARGGSRRRARAAPRSCRRVAMRPPSGRRIRAMHLSSVLLPEPFSPMRPNVLPCRHLERHVAQRPELLVARAPAAHDRGLQRLVALVVQAEPLRDVVDDDRGGRAHTSSAEPAVELREHPRARTRTARPPTPAK